MPLTFIHLPNDVYVRRADIRRFCQEDKRLMIQMTYQETKTQGPAQPYEIVFDTQVAASAAATDLANRLNNNLP